MPSGMISVPCEISPYETTESPGIRGRIKSETARRTSGEVINNGGAEVRLNSGASFSMFSRSRRPSVRAWSSWQRPTTR